MIVGARGWTFAEKTRVACMCRSVGSICETPHQQALRPKRHMSSSFVRNAKREGSLFPFSTGELSPLSYYSSLVFWLFVSSLYSLSLERAVQQELGVLCCLSSWSPFLRWGCLFVRHVCMYLEVCGLFSPQHGALLPILLPLLCY